MNTIAVALKDKLMDSYQTHGTFPLSLSVVSGNYFQGPIRCHYKPRTVYPAFGYALWVYFTYPLIYNVLKMIFGAGAITLLAGLAVLGISTLLSYPSFVF